MRSHWCAAALLTTFWLTACNLEAKTTQLDDGYRQMYNLQFADAHRTFAEYQKLHPDDPLGPVSDAAAYLFSEFDRLKILQSELFVDNTSLFEFRRPKADPAVKQKFEAAIQKGRELAQAALARSPGDANAKFATVLRMGLYSDYLALIEKRYIASFAEMKTGRELAQSLLTAHPDWYDAYLAIGVENYMLSLKPAPVRWLLRASGGQTDKDAGIKRLRITAEKGRYLMPFARLLLAVAALRDNDRQKARELLGWLTREFPGNPLYREELAKLR
jgi:hypothetical protein